MRVKLKPTIAIIILLLLHSLDQLFITCAAELPIEPNSLSHSPPSNHNLKLTSKWIVRSHDDDDDYDDQDEYDNHYHDTPPSPSEILRFQNPRLETAYFALQTWKHAILSDPYNRTANWIGSDVCNYTGIFCWPAPDNASVLTVAGIDLNHANLAGQLVNELGLLTDLALIHLNTNRFCGTVPRTFKMLKILHELDLSNNRFAGKFPYSVLDIPKLKYLDIRFNEFEGRIPRRLFDKDLDAIFINHNSFASHLPENIGNSPASVMVLAGNNFHGCLPPSFINMSATLHEVILMDNGMRACLPKEIGSLKNLTVFDASHNRFVGPIPDSFGELENLEVLNLGHNMLSGDIPETICSLPKLWNFTAASNFFDEEAPECRSLEEFNDGRNCVMGRRNQRSRWQCEMFESRPKVRPPSPCEAIPPPPPPPPPVPCAEDNSTSTEEDSQDLESQIQAPARRLLSRP
ncbi:Leucine-rich repeat extensin-like protein 4 [Linum grandiflorum]